MRYGVALLTSPGREEALEKTLRSFEKRVSPRPTEMVCYVDGGRDFPRPLYNGTRRWDGKTARKRRGFCEATAALWQLAAGCASPWILWLEDDFEFVRSVDLIELAHVLEREPHVAQMALCRQAVNDLEIAAGGLVESRPGEFERRGGGTVAWLEQRSYWTTNPSLFRRSLAESFPWPTEAECEGRFGFGLRASLPETSFGLWGVGDPWVRHVGARQGFGY